MITPTYARWTQKADLTRLCQTLMHVPSLHWIVVEDSEEKTDLVKRLLGLCGMCVCVCVCVCVCMSSVYACERVCKCAYIQVRQRVVTKPTTMLSGIQQL